MCPQDLASILVKLMAKDRDRRYQTPEQLVRDLLTVAGSLGLRLGESRGLVWMSAARPLGWERHLVWGLPTVALLLFVLALVWWGQEPGGPLVRPAADGEGSWPWRVPRVTRRPPRVKSSATAGARTQPASPTENSAAPSTEGADPRPRELTVDSGEDLLRVIANAPPRSILVLADDGPYLIGDRGEDLANLRLR